MRVLCALTLVLLLLLPALAPAAEQDLVDTLGPLMGAYLDWTETVEGWQLEIRPGYGWACRSFYLYSSWGYGEEVWQLAEDVDEALWEERPNDYRCIALEVYVNGKRKASFDEEAIKSDYGARLALPYKLFEKPVTMELRGDYVLTYTKDPSWSREVHLTLGPAPLVPPQRRLPDYSTGEPSPYRTSLRISNSVQQPDGWDISAEAGWGVLREFSMRFMAFPEHPARLRVTLAGEEVLALDWPSKAKEPPARYYEFKFHLPRALEGQSPQLAAELEVWKPNPFTGKTERLALPVAPISVEPPARVPTLNVNGLPQATWPQLLVPLTVDPPDSLVTVNGAPLALNSEGKAVYPYEVPPGESELLFEASRPGVAQKATYTAKYLRSGLRLTLEGNLVDLDAGQKLRGQLTSLVPCEAYAMLNDLTHSKSLILYEGPVSPDKPITLDWGGAYPGPYGDEVIAPAGDFCISVLNKGMYSSHGIDWMFLLPFRVVSKASEPLWEAARAGVDTEQVDLGDKLYGGLPEGVPDPYNQFWLGAKSGGLTFRFTGVRAEVGYARLTDGGRARLFVDGQQVGVLSFRSYSGKPEYPLRWSSDQLPSGDHTLYVEPIQPKAGQPLQTPIETLWAWRAEGDVQRHPVDWPRAIGFEPTFGPEPIDSDTYFDRPLEFPEAP